MPANRNALIRYKTIDNCLKNRRKKWTLEMLIDKVSEALYEYEGISKGISRRTIQADIQMMRSNKLGYNAPIIIADKKYYTYEDADYSITNIPLSEQDLGRMNEAVEMLKQFKGFSHFSALHDVVQKLEGHVYAAANSTESVIDFEKNELLKGLSHLDMLYNSIIQKKALLITYRSFKAKAADVVHFHPWWLKEFNNRWFVIGVKNSNKDVTVTFALDRIEQVEIAGKSAYVENTLTTIGDYYKHVIGVTVNPGQRPQNIKLFFTSLHAPYVETKPLHHTQTILERLPDGIIINIRVQINFELERVILGFCDGVRVLAPEHLKKRILQKMKKCMESYEQ